MYAIIPQQPRNRIISYNGKAYRIGQGIPTWKGLDGKPRMTALLIPMPPPPKRVKRAN